MNRWNDTYRTCPNYSATEEGMTDFVRRHRDLKYCANEGCKGECRNCAANKCNGYGSCSSRPTIKFANCRTSPF